MVDFRPVGYVLGHVVAVLGMTMWLPFLIDYWSETGNASAFAEGSLACMLIGGLTALACQNRSGKSLSIRQGFLLTIGIWLMVPLFSALPLVIGAPHVSLIDAYFEAVSGITTTGASVFVNVDALPEGVLLWRAMLNWLGGLGIAFIAMIFLPVMRVGGMQFFRTEGFDTFGKALPRATDIARELFAVYAILTILCMIIYRLSGMPGWEAVLHSLTTISTGGFSPRAASFQGYPPMTQYAGALFMILGSLPYIRYVQLMRGGGRPLLRDPQVRAYLGWIGAGVVTVTLWRLATNSQSAEEGFRETLFNLVSIISSTGYSTGTFVGWGSFPMIVALWLGIIGACSGSSAAGLSVFRVQIALAALGTEIRKLHSSHRIAPVRYAKRRVDKDTMDAIILYLGAYILSFGLIAIGIVETGVDFESAIFASWTSIGNIGYGYGSLTAATGTFIDYPDPAKLMMVLAMISGRLSLLSVFVVALPRFWLD